MAKARKDNKGRVLLRGESQRSQDMRYVYTYTDPFGNRKYLYATDLMELRQKEDKLKRDQLDGLDVYVAGKATINFVFDRYISTKYDLRKTTRANYEYTYDHFVRGEFGKKLICDVKYSDIRYFYYHLLNDLHLKPATVDNVHTVLHPTFQLAVRDNIIRNNPTDGVMAEIKKKTGKNKSVRHALTKEQQRAYLGFLKEHPVYVHWYPLFTVLFGTGCRIGEVAGLRWQDIDLEEKSININHGLVYFTEMVDGKRKSRLGISYPKTEAGIRMIPMLPEVGEAFRTVYNDHKKTGFNKTVIDGMDGFIFKNRFGNVINQQSINDAIKRIVSDYNGEEIILAKKEHRKPLLLPMFSCHYTRHTFCTRFCETETNVKVIQEVMGHKDITTTLDIYAEVTEAKKREALDKLSKNMDIF